jgi:anti-anti-sigma factor
MDRRTDLTIESHSDGHVGFLRLKGEVRADVVSQLHDAADAFLQKGIRHLVVDVSGITFIDSASVGELVRLDRNGMAAGCTTVLHSLPRIVRRVLDVTGLSASVCIAADEAGALALLE